MVRYRDGLPVATTLFEAAVWHFAIKPVCRCGHSAAFNAHCLWWRYARLEGNGSLRAMQLRFWCRKCSREQSRRVRPIRIELVGESATDIAGN